MGHSSLENKPSSGRFRRALTNHYLSCESLLPWQGAQGTGPVARADFRDVIVNCGEDPYAFKGYKDLSRPFVRARTFDDGNASTRIALAVSEDERTRLRRELIEKRKAFLKTRDEGRTT